MFALFSDVITTTTLAEDTYEKARDGYRRRY